MPVKPNFHRPPTLVAGRRHGVSGGPRQRVVHGVLFVAERATVRGRERAGVREGRALSRERAGVRGHLRAWDDRGPAT